MTSQTRLAKETRFKMEVLKYIKDHTGLELTPCDYFTRVRTSRGKRRFEVILNTRTCESYQFPILERLAKNSSVIFAVQPGGVDRVSIVCY